MSQPVHAIPTTLILGFLGVGKTTAILDLLRQKPADETWAVLVNEFGEVGIDGAMLQTEGAYVKEVPGGCMCCVAGLPMQIGLNQLIHRARPDRLLIEPTGLGHPAQIIQTLTQEHYRDVLHMGPVITLVDPRKLDDERVRENVHFRDQVAAADILVANKTDLCTPAQLSAFDRWAGALEPAKQQIFHNCSNGMSTDWLHGEPDQRPVSDPHAHAYHRHDDAAPPEPTDIQAQPWQMVENRGQGHFSLGWRVHPEDVFDESQLLALAGDESVVRFKAVVRTPDGWRTMNIVDGVVSTGPTEPRDLSRLELISESVMDAPAIDRLVRSAAGREPVQ